MKRLQLVVSGLALWSVAVAQEPVTPGIDGVVKAGTPIVLIKEGFDGTEGPIAMPDGSLVFTETRAARLVRIAADNSTASFLENSGGANGLAFTRSGDLVAVQTVKPGIAIIYPENNRRVLVDSFEGKPLGRPNDLTVSRDGRVYFTDPNSAPPGSTAPPGKPAVYFLPAGGALQKIIADIERPNGILLSPDEKTLYVANTAGEHILAYDVANNGEIGAKREFAKLAGYAKNDAGVMASGADGLAVDANNRLYVASTAGVQVFDAKGKALGVIPLPKPPQNLAFAGKDKKTLYVVGRGGAWRIDMLAQGFKGRAK